MDQPEHHNPQPSNIKNLASSSPVNSFNEWDPLEEVILGTSTGMGSMAKEPVITNLLGQLVGMGDTAVGAGVPFNKESIAGANRQLDNLCRILENEGVKVRRPDPLDHAVPYKTPDFEVPVGNGATCPRDVLIVFGNEIIEAPMSMRGRYFEYRPYRSLLMEYWKAGAIWTAAPKPLMSDDLFVKDYPPFGNIEKRWEEVNRGNLGLTETEPVWDAADFLRMGKDIVGQHSLATNLMGIEWVRRHLAPKGFRVHTMQFKNFRPRHIDDTLIAIRPGIAINSLETPPLYGLDLFKKSDWKVYRLPQSHTARSLNLNMLSLNDKTVIVEEKEWETIQFMEDLGCRVLQVPFRSVYGLGGSTHCCTVDVRRRGGMHSYFPHLDAEELAMKELKVKDAFVGQNNQKDESL